MPRPEEAFILDRLADWLWPDEPTRTPVPETLDWEQVYALIARHGLARMLHRACGERPGLWPEPLGSQLRRDYIGVLLWGDRCAEQVGEVLPALRGAGLRFAVLKGWALIPTVYGGDYGQRSCADIDLLLAPRDAARAEAILCKMGYRARPEYWPGHTRRYYSSRAFQLTENPGPFAHAFAVALHWGLLDASFFRRRVSIDELLTRAQPLVVAGADALRLASEDELVYECGHLALHHDYDEALYRYFEMAALILHAGSAFDWDDVVARTIDWRLVIPVQRVLGHLACLWGEVIPARVLEAILPLRPTRAERFVHDVVVNHRGNPPVRAAIDWLAMPGVARRLCFIFETAFPSPAYTRRRYGPAPGGLWPLLYPRRLAAALRHLVK